MARIQSFHNSESDNQRLQSIGYNVGKPVSESEVFEVAEKIYFQANLNVMVEHVGTENSIIWVDSGRFKQK